MIGAYIIQCTYGIQYSVHTVYSVDTLYSVVVQYNNLVYKRYRGMRYGVLVNYKLCYPALSHVVRRMYDVQCKTCIVRSMINVICVELAYPHTHRLYTRVPRCVCEHSTYGIRPRNIFITSLFQ